MVGQLVVLKWRLLVNGVRRDLQRAVGLPLLTLVLAVSSWLLAAGYRRAALPLTAAEQADLSLWVMTVAFIVWATLPVLLFPLDETLDPSRFALLPIGRARLMIGLTAAGLVTPPILLPLGLLGVGLGLFLRPGSAVLAVVATLLLLAMLIVGGQAFTTLVSLVVRSRRGRDATILLVAGLGTGLFLLQRAISSRVGELGLGGAVSAHSLSGWRWLIPPAAAQHALVAAGEGRYLTALADLGAAAIGLLALVVAWYRLVRRAVTTPESATGGSSVRLRPFAAKAGWGSILTLARKELRSYLRDPRQRLVWTGAVVFLGVVAASVVVGRSGIQFLQSRPILTLGGPALVLFVGLPIALNQFGWERRSASFLFALPLPPRRLLMGKNLATALALAAEAAVLTLVLAAATGGWRYLPWAPGLAVAAIGCQLAVGNLVSIVTPLRLPELGTDLFSQATEQGCLAIVSQLFSFFTIGILMLPVGVAFALVELGAWPGWAAAAGAVGWGAAVYGAGLAIAARLLQRRLPEVLAAVQTV